MDWLVLAFCLELGIIPNGCFLMYDRQPVEYINETQLTLITVGARDFSHSIYTDMQVEVEILKCIFLGGGIRVVMLPVRGDYTFDPHAINYSFVAGLRLGLIEIFWRHRCIHPQMTYMYDYVPLDGWEGAYDEIGIRVAGRMPLTKGKKRV